MCGIVGIVAQNSKNYQEQLGKAIVSLYHRGPDGNGTYFFDTCALGHTRLSIVDLSTGGQPMLTSDNLLGITFNGEIYGYKEIRDKMVDYDFKTTSDTEVILALYQKYGSNLLEHLPGMFAFALWDEKKQELFCARDRFGEKPFYYAVGKGGEFIFASEIKAILATGLVDPILDKGSLVHYLQHLYVHPTKTIYENVFTLPPAHCLKYKNGEIFVERYWSIPEINSEIELDDAIVQFKLLFEKAVQSQLVADVPVGAFLSGGLDSSTIVALASKYKKNIKTFSFGFGDSINELPFAREVSQMYGTDHIELQAKDFSISELLLQMQDIYDEPFADSSNIPTYLMSKLAKKYSTVVLTGDGGDELLGGYRNWYRPLYFLQENNDLSLKKIILSQVATALKGILTFNKEYLYKYRGLGFKKKDLSVVQAHELQNEYFTDNQLFDLLKFKKTNIIKNINWKENNSLDDAMRMDVEDYMPGDILVKTDRAAMASSLELRAPFLDLDLASFCLSLPHRLKITKDEDKYILRKVFANDWPESIRNRGKQGFGAPIEKWLVYPAVKILIKNYLDNPNNKIFNYISFVNSRSFVKNSNYQTWVLLVLSIWMEKHDFSISD